MKERIPPVYQAPAERLLHRICFVSGATATVGAGVEGIRYVAAAA